MFGFIHKGGGKMSWKLDKSVKIQTLINRWVWMFASDGILFLRGLNPLPCSKDAKLSISNFNKIFIKIIKGENALSVV